MSALADDDWGDLESLPPPRSAAPRWLLFCGGGCLVLVIASIVLLKSGFDWYRAATDEEQQWPRVAEVLPFDERPPGFELQLGMSFRGYQGFWFTSKDRADGATEPDDGQVPPRRSVFLLVVAAADRSAALVETRGSSEAEVEVEEGEIEIQGRRLPLVRSVSPAAPGILGTEGQPALATLQVDLSRKDATEGLLLVVQGRADDPPTDEEVREFLAPFHVGPERGPPAPAADDDEEEH